MYQQWQQWGAGGNPQMQMMQQQQQQQQQMYWQQYYQQQPMVGQPPLPVTPGQMDMPVDNGDQSLVNPAPPVEPPKEEKPPLPPDPPPDDEGDLAPKTEEEQEKMSALMQQAQQWQQQKQWQQHNWTGYQQPSTGSYGGGPASSKEQPPQVSPANQGADLMQGIRKEEQEFEKQYDDWLKQYSDWKEQNKNHPNQDQFQQYEAQWKQYEQQMNQKREDIYSRKTMILQQQQQQPSPHHLDMGARVPSPTLPDKPWSNQQMGGHTMGRRAQSDNMNFPGPHRPNFDSDQVREPSFDEPGGPLQPFEATNQDPRVPGPRNEGLQGPPARFSRPQGSNAIFEGQRGSGPCLDRPRGPVLRFEGPRGSGPRMAGQRMLSSRIERPRMPGQQMGGPRMLDVRMEEAKMPGSSMEGPRVAGRMEEPRVLGPHGPRMEGHRMPGPRMERPRMLGPRMEGPRGPGPRMEGPRGPGPRIEGPRGPGPRMEGPRGPGPRMEGPRGPGPRMEGHRVPDPSMEGHRLLDPRMEGPRGPGSRFERPRRPGLSFGGSHVGHRMPFDLSNQGPRPRFQNQQPQFHDPNDEEDDFSIFSQPTGFDRSQYDSGSHIECEFEMDHDDRMEDKGLGQQDVDFTEDLNEEELMGVHFGDPNSGPDNRFGVVGRENGARFRAACGGHGGDNVLFDSHSSRVFMGSRGPGLEGSTGPFIEQGVLKQPQPMSAGPVPLMGLTFEKPDEAEPTSPDGQAVQASPGTDDEITEEIMEQVESQTDLAAQSGRSGTPEPSGPRSNEPRQSRSPTADPQQNGPPMEDPKRQATASTVAGPQQEEEGTEDGAQLYDPQPQKSGPRPGGPLQSGPRPGGPLQSGPRPGGPQQSGPRPGGPLQSGPRPGGPQQSGPRPGGPQQSGPRPGGPQQSGPRPGGPQQSGPRPGGPQQSGPRPGSPQQSGPRPGGPQQSGPRPGSPQQSGPRPGGPQQSGPRPGSPQQSGPRPGGPQQSGPRPGGPQQSGPRPGGPQQSGPRPGGPQQSGPRPGGPQQSGPRPGGPQQSGPRPGGPHQSGPRPGGPQQSGPRPGGPQQSGPRPHGPQQSGPRPGGPQQSGPTPGGPQQSGPRPGGPQQSGPRPHGPQQSGPRPGGPQQSGPRPGGPHQSGPRPGSSQQSGSRPGSPQQSGPRPGSSQQSGPRPGGPQQSGPRPHDSQQSGPRPGGALQSGPRPGGPQSCQSRFSPISGDHQAAPVRGLLGDRPGDISVGSQATSGQHTLGKTVPREVGEHPQHTQKFGERLAIFHPPMQKQSLLSEREHDIIKQAAEELRVIRDTQAHLTMLPGAEDEHQAGNQQQHQTVDEEQQPDPDSASGSVLVPYGDQEERYSDGQRSAVQETYLEHPYQDDPKDLGYRGEPDFPRDWRPPRPSSQDFPIHEYKPDPVDSYKRDPLPCLRDYESKPVRDLVHDYGRDYEREPIRSYERDPLFERDTVRSYGCDPVRDYKHGDSENVYKDRLGRYAGLHHSAQIMRDPYLDPYGDRYLDRRLPIDDPYRYDRLPVYDPLPLPPVLPGRIDTYSRVLPPPLPPLPPLPPSRDYFEQHSVVQRFDYSRTGATEDPYVSTPATLAPATPQVIDYGHGQSTDPSKDQDVRTEHFSSQDFCDLDDRGRGSSVLEPSRDQLYDQDNSKSGRNVADDHEKRSYSRDREQDYERRRERSEDKIRLERERDRDYRERDRDYREHDREPNNDGDRDWGRTRERDRSIERDSHRDQGDQEPNSRDRPSHGSDNKRDRSGRNSFSRHGTSSFSGVAHPLGPFYGIPQGGPPPAKPKQAEKLLVDEILCDPGRRSRPDHIVVLLRGLPGAGKTYVSKLIRDREVANGGSAPRMLCLDDYFMVDVDKMERDTETGKMAKKTVLEYEYDEAMEASYRVSFLKNFKRQIDDCYFKFIIVDAVFDKSNCLEEFWGYAKSKGFQVYVAEISAEPQVCAKRNIHNRTLPEIRKIASGWELIPSHHITLDLRSLLQDAAIEDVEMEEADSQEEMESGSNKDDKKSEEEDEEEEGYQKSKWELDTSENHLDKLDGIRPAKRKEDSGSKRLEDYLQLPDDYDTRTSTPGKKRVRWVDLEERKQQTRMREIGFVVGQTNWDKMTDDSYADRALNQMKYI